MKIYRKLVPGRRRMSLEDLKKLQEKMNVVDDVNLPYEPLTGNEPVEEGTVEEAKPTTVNMMINGRMVNASLEKVETYKSLLTELHKAQDNRPIGDLHIDDEYFGVRARLDDFVSKL